MLYIDSQANDHMTSHMISAEVFSKVYIIDFSLRANIFLSVGQWHHVIKCLIRMISDENYSEFKYRYLLVNKFKAIENTFSFFSFICHSCPIFLTYTLLSLDLLLLTTLASNLLDFQNFKPWLFSLESARQYSLAPLCSTRKETERSYGDQIFLLCPTHHLSS